MVAVLVMTVTVLVVATALAGTETPDALPARALVVALGVARLATLVAGHDLVQSLAHVMHLPHGLRAGAVALAVAHLALRVALHCCLHLLSHLWALWQRALGMALEPTSRLKATLVAIKDWLCLFTLLLESLPGLGALLMAGRIAAAVHVAGLHLHHLLLHSFMEAAAVVSLLVLILVAPHLLVCDLLVTEIFLE